MVTAKTYDYEITQDGHVFSLSSDWRGYGKREMMTSINKYGYLYVRLVVGGKRKKYYIHQLVARNYLPAKPKWCCELRHLDGNKLNNHYTNLAWGTRSDNALDRQRDLKIKKKPHNAAKLSYKDVKVIRHRHSQGESYASISQAYPITPEQVSSICRMRSWIYV